MTLFGYPEILLSIAVGVVAGIMCSAVPFLKSANRRERVGSLILVTGALAFGVNIALAYYYHEPAEYWRESPFLTYDNWNLCLFLSAVIAFVAFPFALTTSAAVGRLSRTSRERRRNPRGLHGESRKQMP